jgi:hypothetical protein
MLELLELFPLELTLHVYGIGCADYYDTDWTDDVDVGHGGIFQYISCYRGTLILNTDITQAIPFSRSVVMVDAERPGIARVICSDLSQWFYCYTLDRVNPAYLEELKTPFDASSTCLIVPGFRELLLPR